MYMQQIAALQDVEVGELGGIWSARGMRIRKTSDDGGGQPGAVPVEKRGIQRLMLSFCMAGRGVWCAVASLRYSFLAQ